MIIAMEGMDGCGKSSVAKSIAKTFNYDYRAFPNKALFNMTDSEYSELCDKVYDFEDEYVKAWFFGFGNIIQTKNIGNGVILDRHLLSNYFWNGTQKSEKMFETLIDLIGKPDLTIVLYAGNKVRADRINQRNPDDRDLKDPEKMVLGYDKMITFAGNYNLPFLVINTEKFDLAQTTKICEQVIKRVQTLSPDEVAVYCKNVNNRLKASNKEPFSQYLQEKN